MDTFLKIMGIGALALIGGLAVLVIVVWMFWRKIKKALRGGLPPSSIELQMDPNPDWLDKPEVRAQSDALEAAGFARGHAYTIEKMPDVKLLSFCHPATHAFACVYDHGVAGVWTDVCANVADGREFTVSNAPMGSELETRPETVKTYRKDAPAGELVAMLHQQLQGLAAVRVGLENFAAEFAAAYGRDMAWRNTRGISESEVRKIAENHFDGKLTEEQLQEAFIQAKSDEIGNWAAEGIESFCKTSSLSVAEWRRYENDTFIFSGRFHPAGFLHYLAGEAGVCPDRLLRHATGVDGGSTLRDVLGRIAAETGAEFVKLGDITEPIAAEVYAIKTYPAEPDTDERSSKEAKR